MITRAVARYIRISPRKFRLIIPLIKGKSPEEAIVLLASVNKKASVYAIELLKSALANAKRIQGIDESNLYISKMVANCGPTLKRFRAASMGRATTIRKRTSHIVVELDEMKRPMVEADKEARQAKIKDAGRTAKPKAKAEAQAAQKPTAKAKK